MGSWNTTCMLTRLPIQAGEKVAGVLLVKKGEPRVTSLPNEVWTPASPILFGEYDGYGSMEPFESDAANWTDLQGMYQALRNSGELSFYDGKHRMDATPCIEDLLHAASYGENLRFAWCKSDGFPMNGTVSTTVTLAIMKKSFFDFAIASSKDLVDFYAADLKSEMPSWGGAFSTPHSVLKKLLKLGGDVASVMVLNGFLTRMRMQWEPTSGAGNTDSITSEQQVEFYEAMAKEARLLYEMWGNKYV